MFKGGVPMADENLIKQVTEDIDYCKSMWSDYSHDGEKMAELFNKMLFKYMDIIDGIDEGLKVISSYEEGNRMAEVYRINVGLIIKRLEDFKINGCDNERLKDYYAKESIKNLNVNPSMDFNQARIYISEADFITTKEREEISDKIDEIESICIALLTPKEKWEKLRPYVLWVSGKRLEVAMRILPLFLKVKGKESDD